MVWELTQDRDGWLEVAPSLSLYYRDYAWNKTDALPVICLHGYWRTSRDFEELARHLSARTRTVLIDLRGRGKSGRSGIAEDYRFDLLVQDVITLMDTFEISRAVFVGVALGAEIAMELASSYPDRVAGIVLNDSAPESNPAAGKRMLAFSGGNELTREEAVERVTAQYAADFPKFTDQDIERLVYRNYAITKDGAYVRDFDQLTNVELAPGQAGPSHLLGRVRADPGAHSDPARGQFRLCDRSDRRKDAGAQRGDAALYDSRCRSPRDALGTRSFCRNRRTSRPGRSLIRQAADDPSSLSTSTHPGCHKAQFG